MYMKRIALLITAVALICAPAGAQNLLKNLGNRAKNAVEKNVGNKVEKAVNDILDGKVGAKDKEQGQNDEIKQNASQATDVAQVQQEPQNKPVQTAYAKTDFVPGDVVIFDDPMDGEQLGEFPSMWELRRGETEVVEVNGKKAVQLKDRGTSIYPLMKNPRNFLGDVFTVEFDWFWPNAPYDGYNTRLELYLCKADSDDEIFRLEKLIKDGEMTWYWQTTSGRQKGTKDDAVLTPGEWHHIALSFNKRALKLYFDGVRQINLPNVSEVPGWFYLALGNGNDALYLTNFKICQGAVPLYDRLASEGKIVTYAITFDTGKATLKPEADVEINRIKGLMEQDPSLKFEVQGHCDNTGSDAVNDPLSQKRAEAIVARLVEMGIAKDRLSADGKGSHEPIADNSTEEGRAKNRRVEFVKK